MPCGSWSGGLCLGKPSLWAWTFLSQLATVPRASWAHLRVPSPLPSGRVRCPSCTLTPPVALVTPHRRPHMSCHLPSCIVGTLRVRQRARFCVRARSPLAQAGLCSQTTWISTSAPARHGCVPRRGPVFHLGFYNRANKHIHPEVIVRLKWRHV